jgi:ankyrin repeat protein
LAIRKNNTEMVALLLRFGVKNETYDAVHLACRFGDAEMVQLLLNHNDGVDINTFSPRIDNRSAISPLCEACQRNHLEIAQLLVHHGAQVIFNGTYPGSPSPLMHATEKRSLELVQLLLDNSPFSANNDPG